MSELQLVTSLIGTAFTIGNAVLIGLIIRDELNFEKLKSILANVRRYGFVLSLEQYRALFYSNAVNQADVLRMWEHAESHTIDDNMQPLERRDSPWAHTKVEMTSGNVRHPDHLQELFDD